MRWLVSHGELARVPETQLVLWYHCHCSQSCPRLTHLWQYRLQAFLAHGSTHLQSRHKSALKPWYITRYFIHNKSIRTLNVELALEDTASYWTLQTDQNLQFPAWNKIESSCMWYQTPSWWWLSTYIVRQYQVISHRLWRSSFQGSTEDPRLSKSKIFYCHILHT